MEKERTMTNGKWAMLFALAVGLDIFQLALDYIVFVGVFLNPIIDALVGLALPWYMRRQGVKPSLLKILAWVGVPAAEIFTLGGLPFWWLDILFLFVVEKFEERIRRTKLGGRLMGNVDKAMSIAQVVTTTPPRLTGSSSTPPRVRGDSLSKAPRSAPQPIKTPIAAPRPELTPPKPAWDIPKPEVQTPDWQKEWLDKSRQTTVKMDEAYSDLNQKRIESGASPKERTYGRQGFGADSIGSDLRYKRMDAKLKLMENKLKDKRGSEEGGLD